MFIVTGGAGFIGSVLVWKLNQLGVRDVIVVDRLGTGPKWKNLAKRRVHRILHKDAFLDWLDREGPRIDVEGIFHLGACSSTTEADADYLVRNNIDFSIGIWRYCTENEIPLVYASSAATYGAGEHGFVDSEAVVDKLAPLNPYGFSKQKFDEWALAQTTRPPYWAGLKFFNVYGPQEYHKGSQASVVYHFHPQVKATGALRLFKSYKPGFADGEQKRDFVYVKDVVDVMMHLFEQRHRAKSGLYNVGTGKARTFLDLARATMRSMGVPEKVDFIDMPEALRGQYQYFTQADLANLRERGLYTKPMTEIEAGVDDYVRRYLQCDDPFL